MWQKALLQLKKIPVDPKQRLVISRSLGWESQSEVNFQSAGRYRINGILSIPRTRGKVPAVISFHDYREDMEPDRAFGQAGLAHLSIQLRGHADSAETPATPVGAPTEPVAPRLLEQAGLDPLDESYPFLCFLDALRSVDFLRLQKSIDHRRLGLLGKGFGAAMAVFTAAVMKESILAMALERPGFLWLPQWLEDGQSDMVAEVRSLMGTTNNRLRGRIRKNLELMDPLNWSELLKPPVMASIGLEDEENPPRPAFGFFNHLKAEKFMEIYPSEADDPDGREQRKKSVRFLAENLAKK